MSIRRKAYDQIADEMQRDIGTLRAAEERENELSGLPKGHGVTVLALRTYRTRLAGSLRRRAEREDDMQTARWAREQEVP